METNAFSITIAVIGLICLIFVVYIIKTGIRDAKDMDEDFPYYSSSEEDEFSPEHLDIDQTLRILNLRKKLKKIEEERDEKDNNDN